MAAIYPQITFSGIAGAAYPLGEVLKDPSLCTALVVSTIRKATSNPLFWPKNLSAALSNAKNLTSDPALDEITNLFEEAIADHKTERAWFGKRDKLTTLTKLFKNISPLLSNDSGPYRIISKFFNENEISKTELPQEKDGWSSDSSEGTAELSQEKDGWGFTSGEEEETARPSRCEEREDLVQKVEDRLSRSLTQTSFKESLRWAKKLSNCGEKKEALVMILDAFGRVQDPVVKRQTLQRINSFATTRYETDEVKGLLVSSLIKSQKNEEAKEIAEKIDHVSLRAEAFSNIAIAYAKDGCIDEALLCYDEIKLFNKYPSTFISSHKAACKIAEADQGKAQSLLSDEFSYLVSIQSSATKKNLLEEHAQVCARLGFYDASFKAAELLKSPYSLLLKIASIQGDDEAFMEMYETFRKIEGLFSRLEEKENKRDRLLKEASYFLKLVLKHETDSVVYL
ncbi:MAG: hypothetical protein S4CHLAM45_14960 [Chlamydiales bacterium]|nr:hypothetical protein [Chlamydiales bacterium]MCH9620113.1 hypothetical protein [Chlamydiales bacterium]MCH9623583.1 hypothetical protein [Chlamydiales bacterium]